jgi:REP element-mobilizing transposase RayT
MSVPRWILDGMVHLVTRRILRRTHLLRPDGRLNEIYIYALAVIAKRHGILIHAIVVMSNHEHILLSDPFGRVSVFLRELHRLVALNVKVLRKWDGAVWDHEKPSIVQLCTVEAVVEKLAYIMANPVAAGLVWRAHEWPGLTTTPADLGTKELSARRPEGYFDADNPKWPEHASLQLAPLEIGLSSEQLQERVAAELERLEGQAHAELETKGRRVLGAERVQQLSPYEHSSSWEPIRERNPHFAVGRGQRKAFFRAARRLRAFRQAYREALAQWRSGVRDVIFPAGTWLMRVLHDVRVVPPDKAMLPLLL